MIRPFPLLVLLLLASPARAATVLSVGDGDTIRVMEGNQRLTIRLACIDTPETAQRPYGAASRQILQQQLPLGSTVNLQVQTKDRYGRTVAEVLRDGRSVKLAMVTSDKAFTYRKYLAACNSRAYLAAEAEAQRLRRGFWSVPGGIRKPWDWRHGTKSSATAQLASPVGASSTGSAAVVGQRYKCNEIGSFARAQELLREGELVSSPTTSDSNLPGLLLTTFSRSLYDGWRMPTSYHSLTKYWSTTVQRDPSA